MPLPEASIDPTERGKPRVVPAKPGVSFDTCHNLQRDFRKRFPFETDSKYPFDRGIA